MTTRKTKVRRVPKCGYRWKVPLEQEGGKTISTWMSCIEAPGHGGRHTDASGRTSAKQQRGRV